MDTIGSRIQHYRIKEGLTQEELADLIGSKTSTIANYETNNRKPRNNSILKKIACTLKVDVCALDPVLDLKNTPSKQIKTISDLEEMLIDAFKKLNTDVKLKVVQCVRSGMPQCASPTSNGALPPQLDKVG